MLGRAGQRGEIERLHPQLIVQQPPAQRRDDQMHVHARRDEALNESLGVKRAAAPVMAVTMSIVAYSDHDLSRPMHTSLCFETPIAHAHAERQRELFEFSKPASRIICIICSRPMKVLTLSGRYLYAPVLSPLISVAVRGRILRK